MRGDANMEGFWIFQDSEYVSFLHLEALHKVDSVEQLGVFLNVKQQKWS